MTGSFADVIRHDRDFECFGCQRGQTKLSIYQAEGGSVAEGLVVQLRSIQDGKQVCKSWRQTWNLQEVMLARPLSSVRSTDSCSACFLLPACGQACCASPSDWHKPPLAHSLGALLNLILYNLLVHFPDRHLHFARYRSQIALVLLITSTCQWCMSPCQPAWT
jgi:hypothetical protein